MPTLITATLTNLKDLTLRVQAAEGFHPLVAALKNGSSASVDGIWGSSGALFTSALGLHAPRTVLVIIAHPHDLDGWVEDLASFAGIRPLIFPAWHSQLDDGPSGSEIAGQRLRVLGSLEENDPPRYLVATIQSLIQPVPDRAVLNQRRKVVRVGDVVALDQLLGWLVDHGFRGAEVVEGPGEFSRRGGLLDVFSPEAEAPYRLEFFGDDIESIRQFSPQTQRSLTPLQEIQLTGLSSDDASRNGATSRALIETGHLCDYLPPETWTVLIEPEELQEQGKHFLDRLDDQQGMFSVKGVFQQVLRFPSIQMTAFPAATVEAICHLRIESVERFSGDVTRLRDELDQAASSDQVLIACHNEAECHRLKEVLGAGQLAQNNRLHLVIGRVRSGFRMVDVGLVVLGNNDLFRREEVRQVVPRRRMESRAIDSFLDLAEGDLVVHVSHGIARYRGMQILEKNGQTEEHLILEFREGTRVFVPASKIDLVQKYVGGSRTEPELSKLGGVGWQRKKDKVRSAVMDLASEMVDLQAMRASQPGIAYPPDSDWQAEFDAAFPYQETPDQLSTLVEIKRDMERPRPMDRLICGDVGYGKTELAIRAAFKAIDNGKQVAVLVPTTVLAEQHFRTFSQRLAEYPFVVEGISRFRSHGEQKRILERLGQGGIDVIIGTHRLVSQDVKFHDLGLVIIDEEQRFGVEHKERLKRLRQTVDVLTMTATPIPRTLHLALLGIRDISNLETPPPERLAIETRIARFDKELIRHAILRELNREGQIYFVHNRVYNIKEVAERLKSIVPEARYSIAHGQMAEHELEQAMLGFVRRESDILVATTIIESGLDIPNVNTIFINQADNYGLADLHQLRGRVGRYKHRAYAYLLLDAEKGITSTAAKRLKAIEEFTELGAGFKIALRDLEIRGAGNILGTQQSGHIAAVGYEMYCQLLENAVRLLKHQPLRTHLEVNIELAWKAYLPRIYVPAQRQRIEVYRRLARIRRPDKLEDFRQELSDRFGPPTEPVDWLLRLAELRMLATHWQITSIHQEKQDIVFGYRNRRKINRVADRSHGHLRIVDDTAAYLRLDPKETAPLPLFSLLKELLRLPERSV